MKKRNTQNGITRENIIKNMFKEITPQDYGLLAISENSSVEITGQQIIECLNNLYEICEKSPTFTQIHTIEVLVYCIKYEEVKQFLYRYNFLALVRHMLLKNSTMFCKAKVAQILSIFCQVKVDQTNPDYIINMIEWIGEDDKLFIKIVSYLKLDHESLLTNTLIFLYSVAVIVKIRPTSKWVIHFKTDVFKFTILSIMENNDRVNILTIILGIHVILSEAILPETSNNLSVLKDMFKERLMENFISTLYKMEYFRKINDYSVPHWEFYKNWLTLVKNIKEKNMFEFNNVTHVLHAQNIYYHVTAILTIFEKKLIMILKRHTKRTSSFLRLLKHTIVVDKCMRLAEEFKKCKMSLITEMQIVCGVEQKFLAIRILLDILDDIFFCKLQLSNQNEGSDTETEVSPATALDRIVDLKKKLDQYFDSVLIAQNDYFDIHNILYQCMYECEENLIVTQDQTVAQVQPIEYLDYVEARILHITRNDKTHPLYEIFNTATKKLEEFCPKPI